MFGYERRSWSTLGCGAVGRTCRVQQVLAGGVCLLGAATVLPWRPGVVVGHSMEPTLRHGTLFCYDRSYYRDHPLRSGEVVVVRHGGEVWIKRVYAAEGADFWTLRYGSNELTRHDPIRAAQVGYFIQGTARLRALHRFDFRTVRLRVPAGCVFLVGDGANSEDSRVFGPIGTEEVLGRVIELPGQRLGNVPEWVELSSPLHRRAVTRVGSLPDGPNG